MRPRAIATAAALGWLGLTAAQWLTIAMFILGIVLWIRCQRAGPSPIATAAPAVATVAKKKS